MVLQAEKDQIKDMEKKILQFLKQFLDVKCTLYLTAFRKKKG